MPIFAVIIKKANNDTLVKFKAARNQQRLKAAVKKKLKGTGHTLKAVNYALPDVHIDYDYPYRKRHKKY